MNIKRNNMKGIIRQIINTNSSTGFDEDGHSLDKHGSIIGEKQFVVEYSVSYMSELDKEQQSATEQLPLQLSDWKKVLKLHLVGKEVDWLEKCVNCTENGCIEQCHCELIKEAMLSESYDKPITYTEAEIETILHLYFDNPNRFHLYFWKWWNENKKK